MIIYCLLQMIIAANVYFYIAAQMFFTNEGCLATIELIVEKSRANHAVQSGNVITGSRGLWLSMQVICV